MTNDRFKFRVWDDEAKSWRYDMPFLQEDGTLCDDAFENLKGKLVIEQCTGLRDYKWNLIYEGDLVKTITGASGRVWWDAS